MDTKRYDWNTTHLTHLGVFSAFVLLGCYIALCCKTDGVIGHLDFID